MANSKSLNIFIHVIYDTFRVLANVGQINGVYFSYLSCHGHFTIAEKMI